MEPKTDEDLSKGDKDDVISISPPSGAETLFFGAALESSDVTANALLEQLQQNNHHYHLRQSKQNKSGGRIRRSGSFQTAQTRGSMMSVDDFMSCVENVSDIDSIDSNDNSPHSQLVARSSRLCIETIDDTINNNRSKIMAPKLKKNTKAEVATPGKPPLPDVAPSAPVTGDNEMKVDAAEVVYGKAKDIFAWGKSVPVVGFFVGTSEAVAGKALGVVGTDLSQLDGKIESELTKLDKGVLNPAIETIAKILIGVAGKSEEAIKPIIDIILKPLGLLIKSEANEQTPDAHTETPEVTVGN